jgi:hypothetical protein
MKKIILFGFFICNSTFAQNSCFEWAKALGGQLTKQCVSNSVTVDKKGNVYTIGTFTGTTDFDPGTAIYNLISTGASSIYISKLNASGDFEWAKSIGGFEANGASVAIDDLGNVYATGSFRGKVDFDPGSGVHSLYSSTPFDSASIKNLYCFFLLKLDSEGNFILAKAIDQPFDLSWGSVGSSIAVDKSMNMYVTGWFSGTCDFDSGPNTFSLSTSSKNDADIFVAKFDNLGDLLWAKAMQGKNYDDRSRALALDSLGNVYTTGNFTDTIDFDPGPAMFKIIATSQDIFISKLDTDGNFKWAKNFTAPVGSPNQSSSISIDRSGNVYTTGNVTGNINIDFDPGPSVYNIATNPGRMVFISKLNAAGEFVWAKAFMGVGSGECQSNAIATDASQNIYVAGAFSGTTDFDPSPLEYALNGEGFNDAFICKLNPDGKLAFVKQFGQSEKGATYSEAIPYSLAIDQSENIYTAGKFYNTIDFDPGIDVSKLTASSLDYAGFVHKMHSCALSIISENMRVELIAYPNPTSDIATIELPENGGNSVFMIINILGGIVYTEQLNTKSKVIKKVDVSNYAKGIYNLILQSNKGIAHKKLVVE